MATTKEQLSKAEARTAKLREKLRHAELMETSELYRKLHKAALALNAVACSDGNDPTLNMAENAIDAMMSALRATEVK